MSRKKTKRGSTSDPLRELRHRKGVTGWSSVGGDTYVHGRHTLAFDGSRWRVIDDKNVVLGELEGSRHAPPFGSATKCCAGARRFTINGVERIRLVDGTERDLQ